MPRDDFSQATKNLLAKRAGYVCSNPACRHPTSGPSDNAQKTVNIGEAAHITAAAEGGPRYDPSLTPEERKDPKNGIWLCCTDAKLIDSDEDSYSIEKLQEWKCDAEARAKLALECHRSANTSDLEVYLEAYRLMPDLINEMSTDIKGGSSALIREFVVLPSKQVMYWHSSKPRFDYYEDEYDGLLNMLDWLEENSLIVCIQIRFDNSPPMYRFDPNFHDWLKNR